MSNSHGQATRIPPKGNRHLTLVDRKYLHYLSKVDRNMVHHFSGELSLCNEFDPGPEPEGGWPPDRAETYAILHSQWSTVREWVYDTMEILISVSRGGRDDIVEVLTGTEDHVAHPDTGAAPPSVSDIGLNPRRDARNGSREAAKVGVVGLK